MIFAFLSARVRQWLLFAFVLPIVGRFLSAVGLRVGRRNPRLGEALRSAGAYAQRPVDRRTRRRMTRQLRRRRS